MPQDPILADVVAIEPGTTTYGTRRIDRDAADGSLRFADPNVTALLASLVGVRNITGLFIVGRAGDGAPYTTIQAALDDVPDTSSSSEPSLVLVGPGEYTEALLIQKSGVVIVGMGRPKVTQASGSTVLISDTALSTPESVILRDLVLENTGAGGKAVEIDGAGTFAAGTVTSVTAPLAATDTITIGGTVLTGIVGTRVAGSDNFSVDSTSAALMAIEITAAINDPLNSFAATVSAAAVGAVVTITAVAAGVGGNAITLAVATTPGGGLTVSGATLTGGGSAGSPVGLEGISLFGCDLIASGAGGLQIDANTANNIRVEGGSWRGSASNSKALITQCASFQLHGVELVYDLELAYDDGNDQPSVTTSAYQVSHCAQVGDILSNQVGTGSLVVTHCHGNNVIAGGDTTLEFSHCRLGTLSLADTLACTLVESSRGVASVAGGTPTLAESVFTGSVAFAASSSEAVLLEVPAPDATYAVLVDCPDATDIPQATVKAATGFTLTTSVAVTGAVFYTVMRQL
jgi:hypothetical protein